MIQYDKCLQSDVLSMTREWFDLLHLGLRMPNLPDRTIQLDTDPYMKIALAWSNTFLVHKADKLKHLLPKFDYCMFQEDMDIE